MSQISEDAAKQLNNKIYIAVANRMIGEAYCAMGDFDKAIHHQNIHLSIIWAPNSLV